MFSLTTVRSFAFAFLIGTICASPAMAKEGSGDESTYELLNLFGEVFDRVRTDYVEEVSDQKIIESALNGMLTSLDPHSSYMNEKQFDEMKVQTKGEFGGLGIEVTMENGLVKVITPIDDTPAAKAGVKTGDFIAEIDGQQVMGMSLSDAVEKMRGRVGTNVKLSVLREGLKEPLKLTLTRDVIRIQSVRSRSENDVAYIRITSFSENTADAMIAAFEKEKKNIGKELKGVVLDLRNNPGGLLDQAIEVADAYLQRGEIVSTRSRKPEESRRYSATSGDITSGLPIVVLINEGSASASEIVAGALKDHKRAVALGTKTFGKGSVQTVIPISGHGAIRLTTARYYTPSGTSIQAKGITPDIEVQQAKLEKIDNNGIGISEATLRGHLSNDQDKDADKPAVLVPSAPNDLKPEPQSLSKDTPASDDYQLSRALDLIRALSIYQQTLQSTPAPVPVAKPTAIPPAAAKPTSIPPAPAKK